MRKILSLVGLATAATLVAGGGGAVEPRPESPGERLLLGVTSPERIVVVDLAHGTTSTRRVQGGTLCRGELVVTGGRLVLSEGRAGLVAQPLTGTGAGPSTWLGSAHQYLASATPGRIWVTTLRYGRKPEVTSLRETTVDGRRTFFASRPDLPAFAIAGVFEGGLVLHDGHGLRIFEPRRPARRQRAPGAELVAAGADRVVACDSGCRRLRVTTVDRPGTSIRAPRGLRFSAATAVMSPDGSLLALRVERDGAERFAVVELGSGRVGVVPGVVPALHGALAWSRAGDRLFFVDPGGTLRSYRPGAERSIELPIRVGGAVVDIAPGG